MRFVAIAAAGLLVSDCATEGAGSVGVGAGYYDYWYDPWYGGCCVDYPSDVGPIPHPEHPIALPPGSSPRPEQPIAKPSTPTASQRPTMSAPRASSMSMGGMGGGRGGGRR
jgi:hypothetical protein